MQSTSFAKRLDAAMRLEAGKLREKLFAIVAGEKAAALEAAKRERASASRKEEELAEMISFNAKKVREAIEKRKKRNGEEEGGKDSGLLLMSDECPSGRRGGGGRAAAAARSPRPQNWTPST